MNNKPNIDISKQVMSQINSGQVQMRPRWQFSLAVAAKVIGLIAAIAVVCLSIAALFYTLRADMFRDYLSIGRTGLVDLIKTIPWLGVVAIVAGAAAIIKLAKSGIGGKNIPQVGVLAAFLLIALVGFSLGLGGNNTLPSKLANTYRGGFEPQKLAGKVVSLESGKLEIVQGEKKITVIYKSGTQFINGQPELGDTILVLGFEKDGILSAEAIKLENRAEKVNSLPESVPVASEPLPVAAEAPKPAPAVKPAAPAPVPAPAPPPFVKSINITSISGLLGGGPSYKFKINWSSNFSSPSGYKLVWAVAPAIPTYPMGANQNYYYDSGSAMWGYVKNDLTPSSGNVIYNVRVCEYLGGTCSSVYSATRQVTFP